MTRKDYEVIGPKWNGTLDAIGFGLMRDIEKMVNGYDWVKSEPEKRLYLIQNLLRLASSLQQAATSKLMEYEWDAKRREIVAEMKQAPLANPEPTPETVTEVTPTLELEPEPMLEAPRPPDQDSRLL